MREEMTFTNRIRIGDQHVCLDDLPEERKRSTINALIYRPLTTIKNAEVLQTA